MELLSQRLWKKDTYTVSRFFIDGKRHYEILEDKDRGLKQTDSLAKIKRVKVPRETAIPTGRYEVRIDIVSPKYAAVAWYKKVCGGRMPRIMNVPGWSGVLIHPGSTALDSSGCLITGRNTIKGQLTRSRETWLAMYRKMEEAVKRGEKIYIEIV